MNGKRANFEQFGGRSFVLTCATLTLATICLWFGKLSGEAYVTLMLGTVGAYIGGSTFKAHSDTRAETQVKVAEVQATAGPPTKVTGVIDPSPVVVQPGGKVVVP